MFAREYLCLLTDKIAAQAEALQTVNQKLDDPTAARLSSIAPYQGVVDTLLRENRPCRLDSLHSASRASGLPPALPPVHSLLGVPINFQARVYGWLCLLNPLGANTFREVEIKHGNDSGH